jgi:hypothetical protein
MRDEMSTKALVLAVVGAGCVVAAGAGGFVALRMNTAERPIDAASVASESDPASASPSAAASTDQVGSAAAAATSRQTSSKITKPVDAPARSERTPQSATAPALESNGSATPPVTPPVSTDPPVIDPASPPPPPVTDVPPPAQDAPKPRFEELTVKEESVIGIRLDAAISSETAKVEDKVTARVSRDVTVAGHTAIPAGTRLEGVVTSVERGGKFKNPGRLGIRFTSLLLADNTRVAITTEPLSRVAESPGNEATAKVGTSAIVGAILGGLIGGKKGAAIGTAAGATGGAAAVAAGDRNNIVLQAGAAMTVKLTAPVTLLIERDQF